MSKLKAAIYCRFSSTMQSDGYSIEAQTAICSEYCEQHGYEVVRIYEDRAYTGTNFNRPGFHQMMTDAEQGLFSAAVFHKVDRYGRASCEALNYAERLRQLGVKLLFVYEGLDTSNDKDYCEFVRKCADSELYSRNLASESLKSLHIRAKSGLYNGGNVAYGFRIDSVGRYVRDPMTAPIVERIFKLYLDDTPISKIADTLNAEGYRTAAGNLFDKHNLYSILHNERYAGVYTYDKSASKDRITGKRNSHKTKSDYIRLPGMCDAIVTPEQFALAQAKMNAKVKPPGSYSAKHDYHYNGLIYAECGHPMVGNANHTNGHVYTQYKPTCKCWCKSINLKQLDEKLSYLLGEVLFSGEHQEQLVSNLNQYTAEQLPNRSQQYEILDSERRDLTERQSKLISVLETGVISQLTSVTDRLTEIDNRLQEINALIGQEAPVNAVQYTKADVPLLKYRFRQAFCNDKQMPEKSAFIRNTIESITVGNETISVKFKGGIAINPSVKKELLS